MWRECRTFRQKRIALNGQNLAVPFTVEAEPVITPTGVLAGVVVLYQVVTTLSIILAEATKKGSWVKCPVW